MSEENQGLTVQELVAAYDFCQSQRNAAQNENAILAGRLAGAMNKVAELTQMLETLKSEQEEESDGNDGSEQE
jgi:cytidylate kinase